MSDGCKYVFAALCFVFCCMLNTAYCTPTESGGDAVFTNGFVDIGTPLRVSEARGVVASSDPNGRPVIIAVAWGFCPGGSRSSLLIIDALTGATGQYYYPDQNSVNASSYGFALSENKRFFYTMFANYFLEFDLAKRKWTYSRKIEEGSALAWTLTPDGTVFGALLPVYDAVKKVVHLFSFDPKTREFAICGILDDREEQPWSLAADRSGWVYAGIGPARSNIVAYNPKIRAIVRLLDESERKPGTGAVYTGTDGSVYANSQVTDALGLMAGPDADPKYFKGKWYKLFEGRAILLDKIPTIARSPVKAYHWGTVFRDFPDGRYLSGFNLPEGWLEIQDADKKIKRISFNYKREGAAVTAVVGGPDGKVYGSTCHPMHFFAYDPQSASIKDFGGLSRVSGGTFADWKIRGSELISAAYSDGWLYSYDVTKPWNAETGENPNPRFLGQYPQDLGCPQATLVHPDGHSVIFSGFPGYGLSGGGMVIYDFDTHKTAVLHNEQIISGQSTTALGALSDGNLVAGTSPSGGHGGHAIAKEGLLYIMDWKTKKVTFSMVPAKGNIAVNDIVVTPDGLVHGLAGPTYFVFDPARKAVINSQDVNDFGVVGSWYGVRILCLAPDGSVYSLFKKAIVRIDPKTFKMEKLCIMPPYIQDSWVTGGLILQQDRLYFSIGTNIYSYDLKLLPKKTKPVQ